MSRPLPSGKLPQDLLVSLLAALPAAPPELRLGVRLGEDACAIEVPGGLLVTAADPITLTSEEVARLAVVVNANDVAVTGARPRWFLAVILVPPATSEDFVRELFRELQHGLEALGAHLVGGHTEITSAVTRPVVVGHMIGFAEQGRVLATGALEPGDVVVQVRPTPIEGAAVLAREAYERLSHLDPTVLAAASKALDDPGIAVVEPALLAAGLGARSLHDPTEGGLAGGLHEMAAAGSVRIRLDERAVLWFEPGLAVCRALGVDPWSVLASGTLLAAFPAGAVDQALAALAQEGHEAARIGAVEAGSGVDYGDGRSLPWPERDEVARVLAAG